MTNFKTTDEITDGYMSNVYQYHKEWISKEEHLELIKKSYTEGYEACEKDNKELIKNE
jgi:hypothetical protein